MSWIRASVFSTLLVFGVSGCSKGDEEKPERLEYPNPTGTMMITTDEGTRHIDFEAKVCLIDLTDSVLVSGPGKGRDHDEIYWLDLDYLFEKTYDLNGGFSIAPGKNTMLGENKIYWISEENTGGLQVTITGSKVELKGGLVDTTDMESVGSFELAVDCKR